jgi:crotonobetainyl-CoA:carnitine CoA-transferase CaiB-like acyl-CoA transferase
LQLPLEGIRILDLSRLLPGPLCSQLLADLGAEVIKIEEPVEGDYLRWFEPKIKTQSSYFYMVNRNKKSMKLNLKEKAGRAIFSRLAKISDVVLETFRPGVMEALGLGWKQLKEVNPRLIYCALTGYGQTGPYRNLPGHDVNYLSIAGVLDLIGEKGGRPVVPGIQIADVGSGSLMAAFAILAALMVRERSGKGQYLDVAMVDGLSLFLSLCMAQYMTDGRLPEKGDSLLGGGYACYNLYETADGRYMALGCLEPKFWCEFLKAVNREDLITEQFAEEPRRSAIIQEVREIFKQRTRHEWIVYLQDYDVCCTPVNTLEEALADPCIGQRKLWFRALHPEEGEVPQETFPVKFSDINPGWRAPAPGFGEHTREVLSLLGLSVAEIEALAKRKII